MDSRTMLVALLNQLAAPAASTKGGRLSDIAVDIYVKLLEAPVKTTDLDSRYGIERAKDARRQLSRWKLVFEHGTANGRELHALPPEQAWTARAADFTWTVLTTPQMLHELGPTGRPDVDEAHRLCLEISRHANTLYARQSPIVIGRPSALKSGEQIAVALSQLVHQAEREIRAMSQGARLPHLAIIWEALERRLVNHEIQYTRLATVSELIEHGLAIVRRDVLQTGVRLFVGPVEAVTSTFYIVDQRLMLHQDSGDRARIITNRRFVNGAGQKLDAALRKSESALSVVKRMQGRADLLRETAGRLLGEDALLLLDRKIANGKFALKPATWNDSYYEQVEHQLTTAELLKVTDEGYSLPNYGAITLTQHPRPDGGDSIEPLCRTCWCVVTMCRCGT